MAGIKVWYDPAADFLEVTFEDAPAVLEAVEDDSFERRTPEGRIVRFAGLNFSRQDRDRLTLPLAVTAAPVK